MYIIAEFWTQLRDDTGKEGRDLVEVSIISCVAVDPI